MNVIVCGSRSITSYDIVASIIEMSGFTIDCIISGTAKGVDRLAETWAQENLIPVKRFPADWNKYGKKAGILRNTEMINYVQKNGGAVICIWDGKSRGTRHMINACKTLDLKCYIVDLSK